MIENQNVTQLEVGRTRENIPWRHDMIVPAMQMVSAIRAAVEVARMGGPSEIAGALDSCDTAAEEFLAIVMDTPTPDAWMNPRHNGTISNKRKQEFLSSDSRNTRRWAEAYCVPCYAVKDAEQEVSD